MNYVSYSHLDEIELDRTIQEQIAYFAPLNQPFSWHVYEHDSPPELMDRLLAHGFAPDDDPDAVMVLDAQETPFAPPGSESVEVRRIERREDLREIVRVEEQVLGGDFAWLDQRLGPHLEIPGYLNVYVAYANGQPACVGWVYFHPHAQFASLFGGATLPSYRRRGLYLAILAIRVREAIRRGYRFLATGASPMSRPILARNGFQLLTHAYACEWKGGST